MNPAKLARWAVVARLAEDVDEGRLKHPSEIDSAARKHLAELVSRVAGLPPVDFDFVAQAIPNAWREMLAAGGPRGPYELQAIMTRQGCVAWQELARRAETALTRVLKRPAETLEVLHALERKSDELSAVRLEVSWVSDFPEALLKQAYRDLALTGPFDAFARDKIRRLVDATCGFASDPNTEHEAGAVLRELDERARVNPVGFAPLLSSREARRVLLTVLDKWPKNVTLYAMVGVLAEQPRLVIDAWNRGLRGDALEQHLESHRQEALRAVPRKPIARPSRSVDPAVDDLPLTLEFGTKGQATALDVQVLQARLERMGFTGALEDRGLRSDDFPKDMFLCRDLRDLARHNLRTTGKTHLTGHDILRLELDRTTARTERKPEPKRFPLAQSRVTRLPPQDQIGYMTSLFSAIFRAHSDAGSDNSLDARTRTAEARTLPALCESMLQTLTLTLDPGVLPLWSANNVQWVNYAAKSLLDDMDSEQMTRAVPAALRASLTARLQAMTKPWPHP